MLPSDFSTFFWNLPLLCEGVMLSPMWVVDQAMMVDSENDDPMDIDDDDIDSLCRRFESTLRIVDVEDNDIDAPCNRFETALHIDDDDDFEVDPMDVDDDTIDGLCHKFCSTLRMDCSMEDTEAIDTLCDEFQSTLRLDIDDEIDSLCRCFGTMLRLVPDCDDEMDSLCRRIHAIDLDDDPMDVDDPMDSHT